MKYNVLTLTAVVALIASCGNTEPAESNEPVLEEITTIEEVEVDPLAYPEEASVFFVNLENGAEYTSPVHVEMGIEGMEVQPAGDLVPNTGHHHIVINKGHISKGEVVPADADHIHYGKGQTETDLDLEPGNYSLTLQFANGHHQSYGEALSSTIEITVK